VKEQDSMGEPRDTHLDDPFEEDPDWGEELLAYNDDGVVEGPDWGEELLAFDDDPVVEGPDRGEELFAYDLEFTENTEPRCLCLLLLDTSRSMEGAPMAALNQGLQVLREQLLQVPLARKCVEVSIVTFGAGVEIVQDFITADLFRPPVLQARGETPLGTGILSGLDLLEARKTRCQLVEQPYSRPWVFLITDGMPQGEPLATTRLAIQRIRNVESAREAVFFAVGLEGANMPLLARIAVRPPLKLRKLSFAELFTWLAASIASDAGLADDPVALPRIDWGTT
jgi:uncharacterized protein YegL